jgi:hypothetical protein
MCILAIHTIIAAALSVLVILVASMFYTVVNPLGTFLAFFVILFILFTLNEWLKEK